MYAKGTDLSKLPYTDTLQPNPQYKPQQNTQQSGQQNQYTGGVTPMYSQQPANKPMDMGAYGGGSQGGYQAYAAPSNNNYTAYSNPYGSGQQSYYQAPATTQQMPGYQTNYQGQQSPWSGQMPQTPQPQVQSPFGSMDPTAFYAQRDALISKLNDYSNGYAMKSGVSMDGSFGPAPVAPNFQDMWSQAGDMVKGGWQNPFAAPQTPGILSKDSYGTALGEFGNAPMQPYGGSPQPAVAPPAPSPVGAAQPIQPPSQGTPYNPQPDWDRIQRDRQAKEEQGRKIQAERDAQDQRAREYDAAHPQAPGPKAKSINDRVAAIKASQDARPTAAKYADWTRPKRRTIS
jgi:hypothetical protein